MCAQVCAPFPVYRDSMKGAPILSWVRRLDHAEKASVEPMLMGGAASIGHPVVDGDENLRARLRKTFEPVHIEVKGAETRRRPPGASRHGIPT
jgi:hypothetical protein